MLRSLIPIRTFKLPCLIPSTMINMDFVQICFMQRCAFEQTNCQRPLCLHMLLSFYCICSIIAYIEHVLDSDSLRHLASVGCYLVLKITE